MINGYAGNILWVDLEKSSYKTEPIDNYIEWIGGRALGAFLLAQHPAVYEDEPAKQPIIISTGPMVGTGIPLGTRSAVTARNQLSNGFCYSNVGGDFGNRMKMAGFDAVVIQGHSAEPVYVLLQDNHAEIIQAGSLWGMQITPFEKTLQEKYQTNHISFIGIGPAGENQAGISCLMVDQAHAAGWGGSGMIFGAKKLKAIVAIGKKSIPVFAPDQLKRHINQLNWRINASEAVAGLIRGGSHGLAGAGGYSHVVPTAVNNITDEYPNPTDSIPLREEAYKPLETGRAGCHACIVKCLHRYSLESQELGQMQVEGMHANSVRGLGSNLGLYSTEEVLLLHKLCNEFGLDVDGVSSSIAFALDCADNDIIDRQQSGDITLNWGNGASFIKIVRQMGENIGFGKILAGGALKAARKFGKNSEPYALTIKGVGINEQGLRSHRAWALGITTSTRGGGHLGGSPQTENRRISPEVGERLLGNRSAGDPLSYQGKGKLVARTEKYKVIIDTMGLCYFIYGWYDLSIGQIDEIAELFYLITGIDKTEKELMALGTRVHTLERYLSYKFGGYDRKDDVLPERFYNQAVSDGPYKGAHQDREQMEKAKDEYYQALDWEVETGIPSNALMKDLGLGFILEKF